ncbi:glycosyl transferase [Thermosipho melanesiensis]|uniref:Glycosyl transferase, family 2 n=2 Tax=Thermosipho melanesiensis TaxID=46541 RepID=A6LKD1_THEM4|nr:glycosyltransferase [Thermosipho melanesiensis]ABR30382.1 glycosyl transferase, family 2 [Thermosipho melanesiensis BI429]APT73544.1 glycosyltransferase [Thermosipho melanesiensis]OOC37495.1 glycosyl transferase [Thermosipho melanesiensis]OOC39574.1 glycosyl transferase [Thermosipho melanesiensis]OOC39613.1 glycosyl transferase [Thermosipho melanesiensis]
MGKCLLSVAMIVKNEEHNIRRLLESIKDIVDEIVVVDTGSTDKTPKIVKEYTDKLYFHPWKGDFSEARNNSLRYPTCEWVIILDADEEVKEDFKGIRRFLQNLPEEINTVYLPTLSYLDWDLKKTEIATTPRVFRNGTVKYKNIVHNQAVYKGEVVHAPFTIYHYGYIWTRKLREKKYNRTRNLILRHLENKNINPIERIYYLVQLYKTESISKYKHRKHEVGLKTLNEINKIQKIPAIGLEFLFLFGLDILNKGLFEFSQMIFERAINVSPDYPDPYFGLMALYEKKEDLENQYKYAKQFLEKLEYAEKNPEKFEWTVVGFKYKAAAHTIMAKYSILKRNAEDFKYHIKNVCKIAPKTGENIKKFLKTIFKHLSEVDDIKFLKDIKSTVEFLLDYMKENNIKIDIWNVIYLFLDNKIVIEGIEDFVETRFQKFVMKRLNENKDYLIDFAFKDLEEDINSIKEVLFLFKHFSENKERLLKILANLRKKFEGENRGIILSLIGDTYLKLGNFNAAISSYKKAIELNQFISVFIKPVLDDLKTKLDKEIDGTFEELLNYYGKLKELIYEMKAEKKELSYLNLISDSDYAKYVAALNTENLKRKERLLSNIQNIKDFPFYYYRFAKIFEEKGNYKRAYLLHVKACEENPKIGDLSFGKYEYDGLYLNSNPNFGSETDEIVWCKNISERFSGFGVINPIRMWKKSKKFLYAYPYPTNESIKIAKERRKKSVKNWPFDIDKDYLTEIITRLKDKKIRFLDEKVPKSLLDEFSILEDEESTTIFGITFLNQYPDLTIPSNVEKGAFIYLQPDFEDKDDIVWYNPEIRIIKTTSQIIKDFEFLGYRVVEIVPQNYFRTIIFERY